MNKKIITEEISGLMRYINEIEEIDRDFVMEELQKIYDLMDNRDKKSQ